MGIRPSHNSIEPTAIIGPDVKLGVGNYIGHFTIIVGLVTIGDGNQIGNHVVIGTEAQHRDLLWPPNDLVSHSREITIGSNNVIREFVTIHLPVSTKTAVADHCLLMAYSHVSHDSSVADGVVLANGVQLGGGSWIGREANLGLLATVHQGSSVGPHAMVGMSTVVNRDIPPFVTVSGDPCRIIGLNKTGLRRSGFSSDELALIPAALGSIPRRGLGRVPLTESDRVNDALSEFLQRSRRPRLTFSASHPDDPHAQED